MNQHRVWILALVLLAGLFIGEMPASGNSTIKDYFHSPYLIITDETNWKFYPQIAYNSVHNEYLVVWQTMFVPLHREIYGRLVDASGQMHPEFLIYSGINDSFQPSVAYDANLDRYLVVWYYDYNGDETDFDIYGRFIPWDGPIDGEPAFGIEVSRLSTDKPKVVYSPIAHEYLVVWRGLPNVDGNYSISGGIIYNDKTGIPVAISSNTSFHDSPEVTYNLMRNEFVVVWDEVVGGGGTDYDVRSIRLDYQGVPMPPGEFAVTGSTSQETAPTVAACYAADEYIYVWVQLVEGSQNIDLYGRMMTGTGELGDIQFVEGSTLPEQYPQVSCNPTGSEFFLVWNAEYASPNISYGVGAKIIHTDFKTEPSFSIISGSVSAEPLFPEVKYGKTNVLVTWRHVRETNDGIDIWGQLIWPNITITFLPLIIR